MVLFPKATQPKDGYRVVVWEHGTVGVGDGCAPSKMLLIRGLKSLLSLY